MKKGIFCIEGFWEQNNVEDQTSIYPNLDLLKRRGKIPFIHHRCATLTEVEYMLKRWTVNGISSKYPILYLATHGTTGELDFGKNAKLKLERLSELLKGKCDRNIFLFGSCSTMKKKDVVIEQLLESTGALAAMGFKKKVDWLEATVAELLALQYIQDMVRLDNKGLNELKRKIDSQEHLFSSLGFKMVASPKRYRRPHEPK